MKSIYNLSISHLDHGKSYDLIAQLKSLLEHLRNGIFLHAFILHQNDIKTTSRSDISYNAKRDCRLMTVLNRARSNCSSP